MARCARRRLLRRRAALGRDRWRHRDDLHAGAGIVAGSQAEAEYAETALKQRALATALGAATPVLRIHRRLPSRGRAHDRRARSPIRMGGLARRHARGCCSVVELVSSPGSRSALLVHADVRDRAIPAHHGHSRRAGRGVLTRSGARGSTTFRWRCCVAVRIGRCALPAGGDRGGIRARPTRGQSRQIAHSSSPTAVRRRRSISSACSVCTCGASSSSGRPTRRLPRWSPCAAASRRRSSLRAVRSRARSTSTRDFRKPLEPRAASEGETAAARRARVVATMPVPCRCSRAVRAARRRSDRAVSRCAPAGDRVRTRGGRPGRGASRTRCDPRACELAGVRGGRGSQLRNVRDRGHVRRVRHAPPRSALPRDPDAGSRGPARRAADVGRVGACIVDDHLRCAPRAGGASRLE